MISFIGVAESVGEARRSYESISARFASRSKVAKTPGTRVAERSSIVARSINRGHPIGATIGLARKTPSIDPRIGSRTDSKDDPFGSARPPQHRRRTPDRSRLGLCPHDPGSVACLDIMPALIAWA